jgi:DNA-binding response OmpR family regulator
MASGPRLILVVDDDPHMVQFIRMHLEREGHQVIEACTGLEALDRVREALPDLVLLDVVMPELDGFETLKLLRELSDVPVIMLTVRADRADRIRGLELGADDYLTKPFSPGELSRRIKAVLRRAEATGLVKRGLVQVDDRLSIDFSRREVLIAGKAIRLRPTEYRLLYHLVSNAGWVIPHEVLLSRVWGYAYREEIQYLRLYIMYLRQKIEEDPNHPRYILTERGVGYRFVSFRAASAS